MMTYDEIVKALGDHAGFLASAIDAEAIALASVRLHRHEHPTDKAVNAQLEAARDFYVAEINERLAAGVNELRPVDVFMYRRKAVTWALVEVIRSGHYG